MTSAEARLRADILELGARPRFPVLPQVDPIHAIPSPRPVRTIMRRPEFPVFDGHNDTLLDLHVPKRDGGRSFFVEGDTGHIDLPRAERGGFAGGFFAIFVPPLVVDPSDDAVPTGAPSANTALDPAYARSFTEDVIARLFLLEKEAAGRFKVVRTADELDRCLADGIMAAILHFEGAEAIHPDLGALEGVLRNRAPFARDCVEPAQHIRRGRPLHFPRNTGRRRGPDGARSGTGP